MKKKMTSLNNSKNFTIIFDHQFDINEKQNWGTSETILGFQTFFLTQQDIFFLLFNNDVIKPLLLLLNICVFICIYIYISLACNNNDIYLKNTLKWSRTIINLEFYLHLQNTENVVLIASRSKISWHSHIPCIFPYFSNFWLSQT